ncbi:thiol-disulfide oxidoreductase BdbD [Neobacillus bataviensis LMG 21833]|uniref:Thiol-disulfide oxidoreductase BdbD n=1 Tax=Neobacillus bataviensis LMG 21833 TaxID=1117379 RepID=K6DMH2_9BACI|nr:DsbA family protein [Neobacillus bataviensis]EKN69378.1 thiol-disulfide oxidoreductase BdbD [Neobacillus bataviensis LMG 21833]
MAKNKKNNKSQPKSSSKFTFWMIGIIAAFVLGFIFIGNHSKTDDKSKTKESIDYSNQPFLGDKSAPVSIIEFGDYKCPNCKNFNENVIPVIEKELVDTGKAKLYFMNYAFINVDSTRTAKFAESVYHELGNETFWKFHDLIYKKQPEDTKYEKIDLFTDKFLADTLKEVASDAEVNKVVKHFNDDQSKESFNKDMDLAKKLGATGTPAIYVNGQYFDGQTMDDLKDMVDKAAKGE